MLTWAVFAVVTILVSAVLFRLLQRIALASLLSAVVVTGGLQLAVWLQLGHVDEFWPIAAAFSFAGAVLIALTTITVSRRITGATRTARSEE